jgi:hypothetical protein
MARTENGWPVILSLRPDFQISPVRRSTSKTPKRTRWTDWEVSLKDPLPRLLIVLLVLVREQSSPPAKDKEV